MKFAQIEHARVQLRSVNIVYWLFMEQAMNGVPGARA